MYRVAVYCRVSSKSDEQKNSLIAQKEHYYKEVLKNKNCVLVKIYSDTASGVKEKGRKQFNKLIEDCQKGKIDVIVTKSISRFSRNTLEFLNVIHILKDLNIDVYFENEKILLSKERNEFLLTTYAAIAQEESMTKSRNIKWGLEKRFLSGDSKLAQRKCYGYKNDNGVLTIDTEEADIVKKYIKCILKALVCLVSLKSYIGKISNHQPVKINGLPPQSTKFFPMRNISGTFFYKKHMYPMLSKAIRSKTMVN